MCLNCGCHMAHDDHGNPANITYEDVKKSAQANDMGVAESVAMMLQTVEEDRVAHRDEYEAGEHAIVSARHSDRSTFESRGPNGMNEQRQSANVDTRDLDTRERLATTGRAVAEGVGHAIRGEHETERAAQQTTERGEAERIIGDWPDAPKHVAKQMIDKYGPPNEATPTRLFWYRKAPWKRIEVSADPVVHNWPAPHEDFFTQVIDYRVPPEMVHLITMFDGSIMVDRTRGEVWARCDSEAANVLGFNMVHELVTGKKTVEEARETSSQHTVAYNMGRSAPYAERLRFEVPKGGTEDVDKPVVARPIAQQAAGKVKDAITGRPEEATDRRSGSTT